MVSINLVEVNSRIAIAKILLKKMEINGIKKHEIMANTHLSKTAVNSVLNTKHSDSDYLFGSLLKIAQFLNIQLFIGNNEDSKNRVLSLF